MIKYALLFVLSMGILLASCQLVTMQGSGNVTSESRTVGAFERVEVCCGMHLMLTQAETSSVTIDAEDNILPEIETSIHGDTLRVRFRRDPARSPIRPTRPIIVNVQMPTIHGIAMSGGSSLQSERIESDQLTLAFSGSSRGEIATLQSQQVSLEINGGGNVTIGTIDAGTLDAKLGGGTEVNMNGGSITTQQIEVGGGSSYHALEVQSESATVDAGGGSEASLWVDTALQVRASGGSRVSYRGTPSVDQNLSGGSRVSSTGS